MKNSLKEVYKSILLEALKPKLTTNINQKKFNHHTGDRKRKGSIKRIESALNYLKTNPSPTAFISNGNKINLSQYKDRLIASLEKLNSILKSSEYINSSSVDQEIEFKKWRDNKSDGWSKILFKELRDQFQADHGVTVSSTAGIFLNDPHGIIDDAIQYEVDTANMTIDIVNDISVFKDKLISAIKNMIVVVHGDEDWIKNSDHSTKTHDDIAQQIVSDLEKFKKWSDYSEYKDCHEYFFKMLVYDHDSSQLSFKHSKAMVSYSDVDIDKESFESGSLNNYRDKIKELFKYSVKIYVLEELFLHGKYTPTKYVTRPDVSSSSNPRSDIHIEYVNSTDEDGESQKSIEIDDLKIEIKAGEAKGGSGTFYICFDETEHEAFLANGLVDPSCTFELKSISGKSNITQQEKDMFYSIFNSQTQIKLSTVIANRSTFQIEKREDSKVYYYRKIYPSFTYTLGEKVNFDISSANIENSLHNTAWLAYYYGEVKKDALISIEGKGLYLLQPSNKNSTALDKFLNYLAVEHKLRNITDATDGAGVTIRMQTYAKSRSGMKWEAKILPKKITHISPIKLNENTKELYEILTAARYFLSHDITSYDADFIKNLSTSNLLQYKCYNDLNFLLNIFKSRDAIDDVGNSDIGNSIDPPDVGGAVTNKQRGRASLVQTRQDRQAKTQAWSDFIDAGGLGLDMQETKTIKGVYSNLFKKEAINEGIFHMMHPYEFHSSNEFKLGDLLEIINEIENGTLEASEKLDGQNLWFSFRDGQPVFAYNMKELQAGGVEWQKLKEPYKIENKKDIPKDFSSLEKIIRPHVMKDNELSPSHGGYVSFKDGVEVLHHCLSDAYQRDPNIVEEIFNNGENFSSSEVIHSEGPNQILYGENFIAPHFVMDKSGEQFLEKYNLLFDLLKFEQDKIKNPKGFKLITRSQRNKVANQIMSFSDEKEKFDFVNDLREEYNKRIQTLINNTPLTLESTIKDVHRYHLVNYISSMNEKEIVDDKALVESLLLFIHGVTLKDSGLKAFPDYKKVLSRLNLSNAKLRIDFKSSYIGDLIELFFDFGIDINRGIKTTASSQEGVDINHQRIVQSNLNNIKKAFVISKEILDEESRIVSLGEENNPENIKIVSLSRKIKKHVSKIKSVIKRVKARKQFSTHEDALVFIVSSSIEGLVMNRRIPDSDAVMELKLTGFFAPLNQLLNAIRFEVRHLDLLDKFVDDDGQIFNLSNSNIENTYDIEALLERKLNKKLLSYKSYSLLETYNLTTYSQVGDEEFDISVVPMSAKPLTIGHEDLIKTACEKSKEVFVVISTTSRARSYENPITGQSMERLYFEDNPSGFVPDLEGLLNKKVPACRGKVKVVYSKNPVTDVVSIFDEGFAYSFLDKETKYAIFVGDEEDTLAYNSDFLSHMGDRLSIIHKDEDSPRLSSGTKTRRSLNTGRFTQEKEIPIKSKPGQTKVDKTVNLKNPYEEESEEYIENFNEFAANLSNIYSLSQKKRIYDYISRDSRETIDNVLNRLEDVPSNKIAKEKLSKEEMKIMTALGGFRKAKYLSDLYFNDQ